MGEPNVNVVYCPPSAEVLEHFTRHAYRELRPEHYAREQVLDFANFMKAVSSALAKDLTRKANGEFDSGVE
jgi:hypothetical protein